MFGEWSVLRWSVDFITLSEPNSQGPCTMESPLGPGRESNEELRYTINSTTTGSSHTNPVPTTNQPSHDKKSIPAGDPLPHTHTVKLRAARLLAAVEP